MNENSKHTLLFRENSWIAKAASKKLRSPNMALVLGRTIHLYNCTKEEFLQNKRWVRHELCHIQQFRKYGFCIFLVKYLWESIIHGYYQNKYEIEARACE